MTVPVLSGDPAATPDRPAAARRLLRRAAAPGPDGLVCAIDPESAGWDWTTFHVYRLDPGQRVTRPADDKERLLLVLEGKASLKVGDEDLGVQGSRMSVFDGPPPRPARGARPLARGRHRHGSPGRHRRGPRRRGPGAQALIAPEDILVEARGEGNTSRRIHHLLPPRPRPVASSRSRSTPRRQLVQPTRRTSTTPRTRPWRLGWRTTTTSSRSRPGLRLRPRVHGGPLAGRGTHPDGWRRRSDPRGLPPGRRPAGYDCCFRRDRRPDRRLVLHPRPGSCLAHDLSPAAPRPGRDRAVTSIDRGPAPRPRRPCAAAIDDRLSCLHDQPAIAGGSAPLTEDP